ncbi:sugar phosphate isomerase/epimerase [Armatimonas sp.]|uniref:sugar phosphate isomerase/epimerase family protein n=1 Tax=Armatimonas sp. TaxID=1872638 RepID=UPI00286C7AD1|nr:sugar phosphate isomerase/epimerase [Armatimonas sp.]
MENNELTRRSFLGIGAAGALALAAPAEAKKRIPVGLELYSVRDMLAKDLMGTVRAVAAQGYEVVEFYSPYQSWTPEYAKDVRKLLDELKIKCLSTHNGRNALTGDGLKKAIELNQILGSKTIVSASPGRVQTQDDWKKLADELTSASQALKLLKMRVGYHNHQLEFRELEGGFRPIQVLAKNTPKDVTLQFDVGTAVEVGYDPIAWVNENPGRIRSMHLKDWGKTEGYKVLFGEGDTPWKALLEAAERKGGVECFLIEQEGSRYPSLETSQKCLENYRKLRMKG